MRWLILAAALGSPAAAALLYWVEPGEGSWYPKCLLHFFTGLHCPFCGTTRCGHALLNGDVAEAAAYNVLALFLLPAATLWLWWAGICIARGRPLPDWTPPRWAMRAFLIFLFVFWFARNLPFFPFNLLAPHAL